MRGSFRKSGAIGVLLALANFALAQAQSSNPACQRLEAQLAALDRGNADPARAEQIRRLEEMVNRQQFEVDRLVAQSRRSGCESWGFFSMFSNPPRQCGGLNRQGERPRNILVRIGNEARGVNRGTTTAPSPHPDWLD